MVRAGRGVMDMALGSWRRTAIVGVLLVVLFVAVIVLATAVGPLRRTSFPGHPYPPNGSVQNPFSSDPDDLLNAGDVARVRVDFEADGRLELDAFAKGDVAILQGADAGGRLQTLQQLIVQNNAIGIVQRYQNHAQNIVVGRHVAPTGSATTWYIEERGTASLSDVAKASGQVLRTQDYSFDGRFWLAKVGDHYLITDAAISNTPSAGG
jgi:hypothetical protein